MVVPKMIHLIKVSIKNLICCPIQWVKKTTTNLIKGEIMVLECKIGDTRKTITIKVLTMMMIIF